ncbi:Protein phosphatase 2C 2 [Cyberlindnera fabianii]|uniref:protein-serine/threonine phosphatase n=1 Tax=Cyberlindnera fabianii TaxID=36022 RepID=A0A1V2LCY7_CYBFA|nr:Protein phosphatase 2C 2 [Cyberlindnera fabianii]
MGQILSQPVTDKESHQGQNAKYAFGLSSMQGWRINMEDAHTTILNLNDDLDTDNDEDNEKVGASTTSHSDDSGVAFFGVYDGHGGEKIAKFTGETLYKIVKKQPEFQKGNYGQALKDAFLAADEAILKDEVLKNDQSGCTATTVIISDDKIICANAGDSRTVLSVKGNSKALSYDHKPNNEGEHARICAAGGFVDIGRVNGNLALSRAIGDFDFKKSSDLPPEEQIVTAFPDVIEHQITNDDEFVVLACDGIWDCLTSQQVVEVVRRGIHDGLTLTEISEGIIDICLAPTSHGSGIGCDNMSIVIVALLHGKTLEEWYQYVKDNGGPVSESYYEVAKSIYDDYEREAGSTQNLTSQDEEAENEQLKTSFSLFNSCLNIMYLQVFYLDSANLLNTLGSQAKKEDDNEEPKHTITELEEDEEDEEQEESKK